MRLRARLTTAVSLVALIVACVQTNAVRLGNAPIREPVPEDQAVVYRTADQVPRRYEEVALWNARGEASWANEEKMFNSMRKKAGEMGANGIILDAITEPGAATKVAGAILGTGAERKGKAIAIYVFPADSVRN